MTAALTAKGLATRGRIVDGAVEVVRMRGAANTGLDDIRAATGASGSQLGHYFPEGKHQLLMAVAAREAELILEEQRPWLDSLSTWESWKQWSGYLLDTYERQGPNCGLSALMSQIDPSDPALMALVAGMFEQWEKALARGVRALQDLDPEAYRVDPETAAVAILASIQGGMLMMVATGSARHLRTALESALASLHP